MKKAFKIIIILFLVVYFIGNVLPNLIGVPIAAYNSYENWTEINEINENYTSRKVDYIEHHNFPNPIGFVNDYENVFTDEEKEYLEIKLSEYEKTTTREIAVISIEDYEPYDNLKDYSTDLSNEWEIGKKETNNGLAIIFSKKLKEIRVSTGIGTEKILTDEVCKNIIDETIIPYLKQEKYYLGIDKGISELILKWE